MSNHKDITHRSQSLNSFTVTARNIKEFSLKLRDGGRKTYEQFKVCSHDKISCYILLETLLILVYVHKTDCRRYNIEEILKHMQNYATQA